MIRVQQDDFNLAAEMAQLSTDTTTGAVCSFVGLVRGDHGASGMTLEHYPGMTEKQLMKLEDEARRRWDLADVRIIHRYGPLKVGEQIVMVLTASAHREAAFAACSFLMDWLKTKAPFWKQEHTASGNQWVDAKDSDTAAAERW